MKGIEGWNKRKELPKAPSCWMVSVPVSYSWSLNSNLGRGTDHPDRFFVVFHRSPTRKLE
jgi:hypothetical protein